MAAKKDKEAQAITYADITPQYLVNVGIPLIIHRTNDDEYLENQYVRAIIDASNQFDTRPIENIYFFDGNRGLTKMHIVKHNGKKVVHEKHTYTPRREEDADIITSTGAIKNATAALSLLIQEVPTANTDRVYIIMRDIDPDFKDPRFTSIIKRFFEESILNAKFGVILLAYTADIPTELREYAILKDTPYMAEAEVQNFIERSGVKNVVDHAKTYAKALTGLSYKQIINAFGLVRETPDIIDDRVKLIEEIKKGLHETPFLEMRRPKYGLETVGGNNILKAKLAKYAYIYTHTDKAKDAKIEGIKGILLVGPPGTAKSVMSEAFAKELNLPFLTLKMGQIYGKYLGDSEKNLKQALDFAESISCLLQIDEIDKEVGENSNAANATETRIVGSLLSRIAESKNTVFVATANKIDNLPPELIRKGRFDHVFFIDLPTIVERHAILEIHLIKRGFDPSGMQEEIKKAAKLTEGYTGAEIEYIVRESMIESFADSKGKETLMWKTIYDTIEDEVPQSLHYRERFDKARTALATIAKPASSLSSFATAVKEAKQSREKTRAEAH